jgi:hypothetical protein
MAVWLAQGQGNSLAHPIRPVSRSLTSFPRIFFAFEKFAPPLLGIASRQRIFCVVCPNRAMSVLFVPTYMAKAISTFSRCSLLLRMSSNDLVSERCLSLEYCFLLQTVPTSCAVRAAASYHA